MIGKSFLSCADVVWRENLFSSHTARTRATQYYKGRLRPVQEGKNLRRKTKMVNGRNVRLSFQEVEPREKTCTSIINNLKRNDNSKGSCTSPGILIQEPVKSGKAGKLRWKGKFHLFIILQTAVSLPAGQKNTTKKRPTDQKYCYD